MFQLLKTFSDPNGRFVITDIKTESKTLTLVNIYAPNNDDPSFFESVLKMLLSFECEECVWGGDFNLVSDVQKDKQGGRPVTHEKSLEKAKYIIDSLDLVDIWRMLNPEARHFTWRRSCPEIKCRLDFFLISSSLIPAVKSADVLTGFKSDHSLITLTLINNSNPRGPGFWKLNTSLLADEEYIDLIEKTINEVAKEYENNNEVDATLLWDTMKMKIRSSSLCYARQKKNKMSSKENYLEEKITYLQKILDEANVTAMEKQQITEEIGIINSQRDEISKYKTNLEKRHLKQKTIKCLHLSDNEVINTDEEILKEAKSFYQKLYSSTVSSIDNQCDEAEFQFKLFHRRIATNGYLYKIGLKQSDLCTFCGEETENLTHLFLRCKYSKSFWEEFSQWLAHNTSNTEGFVPSEAILLGIVTESKKLLLHHLILLVRHHIYTCKLKETRPSFEMYKQLVYNTLQIESKIAIVNNSMHVFKKKWSCFKNINF